tara:strand:- start:1665 stop:2693 length:1029 start_codon:yes stop_codon:yes gene_type:complete
MNTWATSALTPQLAIELLDDEKVKKKLYPMSLRPQGHDLISFWCFNTVVKAHLHYDSLPWKDVMVTGWALDPHGKKMSKSKGNVVEPQVMAEKYSADALRYWAGGSKLGEDLPFQEKDLVAGQRFVTKLWNASKFSLMHLEDYKLKQQEVKGFDLWLLTKLTKVIKQSTEQFEEYHYSKCKAEAEKFFWQQFCDIYLEVVKDRLYNPDVRGKRERVAGQFTLYTSLLSNLKLFAPFMPHITEEIYQLHFAKDEKKRSIHNSSWPKADPQYIDEDNEALGDKLVEIITQVRKAKTEKSLSMNASVKELVLNLKEDDVKDFIEDLKAVTKAEKISFAKKVAIKL